MLDFLRVLVVRLQLESNLEAERRVACMGKCTQIFQKPIIKECSLNQIRILVKALGILMEESSVNHIRILTTAL